MHIACLYFYKWFSGSWVRIYIFGLVSMMSHHWWLWLQCSMWTNKFVNCIIKIVRSIHIVHTFSRIFYFFFIFTFYVFLGLDSREEFIESRIWIWNTIYSLIIEFGKGGFGLCLSISSEESFWKQKKFELKKIYFFFIVLKSITEHTS